jgi:hypothetical protein
MQIQPTLKNSRLICPVPPSASLRGECGAERSCLILPSATLRGEPGTGDGCPSGDRSAPHYGATQCRIVACIQIVIRVPIMFLLVRWPLRGCACHALCGWCEAPRTMYRLGFNPVLRGEGHSGVCSLHRQGVCGW